MPLILAAKALVVYDIRFAAEIVGERRSSVRGSDREHVLRRVDAEDERR